MTSSRVLLQNFSNQMPLRFIGLFGKPQVFCCGHWEIFLLLFRLSFVVDLCGTPELHHSQPLSIQGAIK